MPHARLHILHGQGHMAFDTASELCATLSFSGTTYVPSLGNSEVVHRMPPMLTSTGIIPQP